jgi:hypothetical protein
MTYNETRNTNVNGEHANTMGALYSSPSVSLSEQIVNGIVPIGLTSLNLIDSWC